MAGNRKTKVVLTSRDFEILRSLLTARVLDRRQVMILAKFGVVRRANSRLLKLTKAGLLKRFFLGTEAGGRKALYALSKSGSALVANEPQRLVQRASDQLLVSDNFIAHQLLLNDFWFAVQFGAVPGDFQCTKWRVFNEPISVSIPLKPDSYFELSGPKETLAMFCEVDRGTEAQKTWVKKTELYLKLATSGQFSELFKQQRFRVLIVATSDLRIRNIRRTVSRFTDKIFYFATFESIKREGIWSRVWKRPSGDQCQSLL